jgi:hypothetical protein
MGYCYLIIPKTFVLKYNENRLTTVCKIGKTDEHHPELRMHVYTKKCKILINL